LRRLERINHLQGFYVKKVTQGIGYSNILSMPVVVSAGRRPLLQTQKVEDWMPKDWIVLENWWKRWDLITLMKRPSNFNRRFGHRIPDLLL